MRDVGIEVREGEVLRPISTGKNTLLKILSGITAHLTELEITNYVATPQFQVAKVGKLLQCEKRADINPSQSVFN
jgi:energy-coupling factor transporter ATP-binding protein EcfA2